MKLPHRRQFLHLAAGAAALPAVSRLARAQTYPTRPVRIIVGFRAWRRSRHHRAPHGSMALGAAWPAIRHREPAGRGHQYRHRGGREGARRWLHAAHGGVRRHAINATLYDKLNFDFIRDIAPVAGIVAGPNVMVVNPSVPATTVPSSSLTPRPIRARSTWRRPASELRPRVRRTVQDDGRGRHGACALSRRGRRADRSAWRAGAGLFRVPCLRRSNTSGRASCVRSR